MTEYPRMPEENVAVSPLISAPRPGGVGRVLETHAAWVEQQPDGLRARLKGAILQRCL
jgi:hypothetical protein